MVICGIGIHAWQDSFRFISLQTWKKILEKPDVDLSIINGHFAVLRWDEKNIECYTDQLGLRNLYITNLDNKFTFISSRLDWIASINEDAKIDLNDFGSRWLLVNGLSKESGLKNVKRLSQSGEALCTSKGFSYRNKDWDPLDGSSDPKIDSTLLLTKLSAFSIGKGKPLSLSLSGGIDSRALLSVLLSTKKDNWTTHSFGDTNHPDNIMARKITDSLSIPFDNYDIQYDKNNIEQEISEFIGNTSSNLPVSSITQNYYPQIQNKIIIDGAPGELVRRRYFIKILLFYKKAILKKNVDVLYSAQKDNKGNIFSNEIIELFKQGTVRQIEQGFEELPDPLEIGIENWLDLYIIISRLPNLLGIEQSRIDNIVMAYMPFAQPDFLKQVFKLSLKARKTSAFIKNIINQNTALTTFPLVKDGTIYKYKSSNLSSAIKIKLKPKLGFGFSGSVESDFLYDLKDYVLDILYSTDTKTFDLYNYKEIEKTVHEFYNGNKDFTKYVDWWFTFEIWRRMISQKAILEI